MLYPILITLVIFFLVYVSMGVRVHRIQSARARKRAYEEMQSPLGLSLIHISCLVCRLNQCKSGTKISYCRKRFGQVLICRTATPV